jgi:uncharacterized membrane protein YgaE (UPF0421/DUF939 family)
VGATGVIVAAIVGAGIFAQTGQFGASVVSPLNLIAPWVLGGFVLGAVWGTIMWAITASDSGLQVWVYLALTMAMIGAGVAGIFGAMNARKKGERISPRIMPKDEAERKAANKAAKAEARAQAKADADARKQSH